MATKSDGYIRKEKTFKKTFAELFRKLQVHEIELGKLEQHEIQDEDSKGVALKVNSREELDEDDSEEFMHLVKRLGKFFANNDKSLNFAKNEKLFIKKEGSSVTTQCQML